MHAVVDAARVLRARVVMPREFVDVGYVSKRVTRSPVASESFAMTSRDLPRGPSGTATTTTLPKRFPSERDVARASVALKNDV